MSSAILKPLPRWADVILLPLLNLLLAFVVSGLVVLAIGQDPLAALNAIVTGALMMLPFITSSRPATS